MKKLKDLRTYLLESPLPLKSSKLLTFIEKGNVLFVPHPTDKGFTIKYQANITLIDFSGDFTAFAFLLGKWMDDNQPHRPTSALDFRADIIDHEKSDIEIAVTLEENITHKNVEGGDALNNQPEDSVFNFTIYDLVTPHQEND
jgi:hypothetical protein